jgi:hypothetical protein
MIDAAALLRTRMFETAVDAWHGWSRSLALPGVEPLRRQLVDLGVVLAAQALPLPRLLLRRGDRLDVVLLAVRAGTLAGTSRAYACRGAPYWLSPLADIPPQRRSRRGSCAAATAGEAAPTAETPSDRASMRAIVKRTPMMHISAPVAAVRRGPSVTAGSVGYEKTPTRAPHANERVAVVTPVSRAIEVAAVCGDSTHTAPAKVRTLRPPRSGEHRPCVADHRRARSEVPDPTARGRRAAGPIAAAAAPSPRRRGTRQCGTSAERLLRVPVPRGSRPDRPQVDRRAALRDQVRDRDRADEISRRAVTTAPRPIAASMTLVPGLRRSTSSARPVPRLR